MIHSYVMTLRPIRCRLGKRKNFTIRVKCNSTLPISYYHILLLFVFYQSCNFEKKRSALRSWAEHFLKYLTTMKIVGILTLDVFIRSTLLVLPPTHPQKFRSAPRSGAFCLCSVPLRVTPINIAPLRNSGTLLERFFGADRSTLQLCFL